MTEYEINEVIEKVLSVSSRRKVLEELVKRGEATAYEIAKELKISDAVASKHLYILCEAGLVQNPVINTTSGARLKKIYKPTADAEEILKYFWKKEIETAPENIKKMFLRGGYVKNKVKEQNE